jgi:hypothetical protein
MQTQHKIDRARQELKVLQEQPPKNRIRKQLSFIDFIAKKDKLGFGTRPQVKKAVSEEIIGDFDNHEALKEEVLGEKILDAVSLFILHGSDLGDQRFAVSELCERLIQMAQIGSVSVIGIAAQPEKQSQ